MERPFVTFRQKPYESTLAFLHEVRAVCENAMEMHPHIKDPVNSSAKDVHDFIDELLAEQENLPEEDECEAPCTSSALSIDKQLIPLLLQALISSSSSISENTSRGQCPSRSTPSEAQPRSTTHQNHQITASSSAQSNNQLLGNNRGSPDVSDFYEVPAPLHAGLPARVPANVGLALLQAYMPLPSPNLNIQPQRKMGKSETWEIASDSEDEYSSNSTSSEDTNSLLQSDELPRKRLRTTE